MAKGYWVANVDVTYMNGYKAYVAENAVPFRKHNAKFLTRGGKSEAVEGKLRSRVVVIEFPSYDAASTVIARPNTRKPRRCAWARASLRSSCSKVMTARSQQTDDCVPIKFQTDGEDGSLTASQCQNGDRQRSPATGGIHERDYLRRLLVNGAISVLLWSKMAKTDPWLVSLRGRKPRLVAAVALANKTARIAWAVMSRQTTYRHAAGAA
jgi:uncharacterized protein (DUF1330 family)